MIRRSIGGNVLTSGNCCISSLSVWMYVPLVVFVLVTIITVARKSTGHDPDNVAIGRVDPVLRPTTPATRHDGSIGSLIKGQQEVVLTGISLTKDQVGELHYEG